MNIRDYLKELVKDAKGETKEDVLISCGTQKGSDFIYKGKFAYLTDTYIDTMPIQAVKNDIILLVSHCFKQR